MLVFPRGFVLERESGESCQGTWNNYDHISVVKHPTSPNTDITNGRCYLENGSPIDDTYFPLRVDEYETMGSFFRKYGSESARDIWNDALKGALKPVPYRRITWTFDERRNFWFASDSDSSPENERVPAKWDKCVIIEKFMEMLRHWP